jgi:hypothetical protein
MSIDTHKVYEAKQRVVEGALTIWNARLEALIEVGDIRAAIDHLKSPVEWGDNCGCGNNCSCGSRSFPIDEIEQVSKRR